MDCSYHSSSRVTLLLYTHTQWSIDLQCLRVLIILYSTRTQRQIGHLYTHLQRLLDIVIKHTATLSIDVYEWMNYARIKSSLQRRQVEYARRNSMLWKILIAIILYILVAILRKR